VAAPIDISALATKPRLRGVVHQYAFHVSLLSGLVLVLIAPTPRAFAAAAVYAASLSALLGASALYHRVHWAVGARRWMARLDHSMISVLIAGTYTPFGLLAVSGSISAVLLSVVWAGALVGLTLHLLWIDVPKWMSAMLYVALGWVGVVAFPQLVGDLGWYVSALLLAGGILYSAGAAVYALQWPDPRPLVFGYHEVFHVLVVAAAAVHYAAVVLVLRPSS
jgi:hemolysin III